MMPAYRSMDSYPYQRNQMPFPPCYHAGIEANPPQMKMDPPKPPFSCEQPWHYGGSYGHPLPMHFCCGHNNFPGYYSCRPSYHHAQVPSPMYYSGGYPAYGEQFFVPYSPQPHYTMEQPRYEYDKYMPRDCHCCGCPNHPCHQKEEKSVKIEEEEPDSGKKVNDALAPIQMRNYPYPIVWIPPEYVSNKEPKNAAIAAVGKQDKTSHDRKPPSRRNFRADAQEPRVWNGWLPFDMYRVPNMVHEGDGRRNQNWETKNNTRESEDGGMNHKSQSEHQRSEFPFPIIWMPHYNKQEEGGRENSQESNSSLKCIEEVPHSFESVPVNSKADKGGTNGTISNQVESKNTRGSDATKEVTNEKIIPVKEVKLHQEENDSEGSSKRERIIPVRQMEENVTKKDSQPSMEKQSSSPRKNGKLPPVCLRVDPLPRKKNGSGSSRSPSPPASKEHSKATTGEASKAPSGGMNDEAQSNSSGQNSPTIGEKVKPKERTIPVFESRSNEGSRISSPSSSKEHSQATAGETSKTSSGSMNDKARPDLSLQNAPTINEKDKPKERTIQVTENKTNENKGADFREGYQGQISSNMLSGVSRGTKDSSSVGDKEENKAEKGAENMMKEATKLSEVKDTSKPTDGGAKKKKALSNVDAAVLIEAAYRGYKVRRWEPLKKLKQIAEVSKELTDVRGRIQALEHSADLQLDEKQKIAIGETIMRLLLKLDTIQGLHSSFREIRKSLARELISLQERLDLMPKKPPQQMHDFVNRKPIEDTPMNTQNEEYVQEQQEEKAAIPREHSSEGIGHDTVEKCKDQSGLKDDIASQSPADPTSNGAAEPTVPPNETVDECNPTIDVPETDKIVEPEVKSEADNIPIEVDDLDVDAWRELPVGVIDEDEDVADHSWKKDEQNEKGRQEDQLTGCTSMAMDQSLPAMVHDSACNEVEDSDIHTLRELPVGVLEEEIATSEFEKDDETKFSRGELQHEGVEPIVELPVGVLDEDTVESEFEKRDEPETSRVVLPADEGESNGDEKTSSSTDGTTKEAQVEQPKPEEQEEVQSFGESDGWVKVEFQKEDKIERDMPRGIGVECEEKTGNEAELPSLTTEVNGHELANGDECMVVNDVKNIQPEPMEFVTSTEKHVPINDLHKEEELEEKVAQQEAQAEVQDIVSEQGINVDNEDTAALAKEKTELSALSPASKVLDDVAEHDGGLNGDAKLLEENEKLRKMMRKLLEAGSEQLNVITDLTGRVKDLEKKLAKSKRVRTKRFRPAASKIRSNSPLQQRAIGVAM